MEINYIKNILQKDEISLYHGRHAKIYRIIFLIVNIILQPIFIFSGLVIALGDSSIDGSLGFAFVMLGFSLIFLIPYFLYIFTEYSITNKRLIIKTGFISRHIKEMNLNSIETITVSQGILDRIFSTGTIIATGRGVEVVVFGSINNPKIVRELIKIDV